MSKPLAKPASDPLIGKPVRILRGRHAGKQGIARRCYRDRVATPDRVMIELDDGSFVSALLSDVEVVR